MYKNFFSLVIFCVLANAICAEDVQLKDHSAKLEVTDTLNDAVVPPEVIVQENSADFAAIKSTEFETLVKLLSPKAKEELEVFIDHHRKLITENPEFTTILNKYNDLFAKFVSFKKGKPIVLLVLSVDPENAFDFVQSYSAINFEEFAKALSSESLNELNQAGLECEQLMIKKSDQMLVDLEHSSLHKELDEKCHDKNFRATFIIA